MSNPFRKKAPGAIDTTRTSSPKSSLRSEDAFAPGSDRKNKPAKKVRVLSPPPLSPNSPEWPLDVPRPPDPLSNDTFDYSYSYVSGNADATTAATSNATANYVPFDPFNGASTDDSDVEGAALTPPPQQHLHQKDDAASAGGNIPANPFSKTLQDIEGSEHMQKEKRSEGEALKAANLGRAKSLNVDSFHRLLMTGNAGDDTSSISTDQEEDEPLKPQASVSTSTMSATPTTRGEDPSSAETSDQDDQDMQAHGTSSDYQTNRERKIPPPPPPSSRHGRSLKQQQQDDTEKQELFSGQTAERPQASAINSIRRSLDEEEAFNRDAKASESGAEWEPTANAAGSIQNNSSSGNSNHRKAPTPPPPRGHARADSDIPRRISSEDAPSRPDSARPNSYILPPAPPPPRRPTARQTSHTSTSSVSSSQNTPTDLTTNADQEHPHQPDTSSNHTLNRSSTAPPPPPARQSSTRRPSSLNSVDAPSRRISSENQSRGSRDGGPPPPPPPRNRGNSPADSSGRTQVLEDPGKSADILADLDALRREVDALRGQFRE